jgi:hypothetical protein
MLAASVGIILVGLMQFAFAGTRPQPADQHVRIGNLFNALVPLVLGTAGFLLGLLQMSRKR